MEDTAIPYELPEVENHSFFFIDQRVTTSIEAKLHRHDAWELYYVVHGYGRRHIATFRSRRRGVNTTVHATPLGIFTGFGRR